MVWLIAIPSWLREGIAEAQATAWTVVRSLESVVFDRLDDDCHRYTIRLPLPEDPDALNRVRPDLFVRVRTLGQQVA